MNQSPTHIYRQKQGLYDQFKKFLLESPVYNAWIVGGEQRQLSEQIRQLLQEANLLCIYDHASLIGDVATGLGRLRNLLHDDSQRLSEFRDLLLPAEYFPRSKKGCKMPLCGSTNMCEANFREWNRLVAALRCYMDNERDYPDYRKLLRAVPTGHWPRLEVNRLTKGKFYKTNLTLTRLI